VNSSGISLNAGAYLTTARASNDAVGLNTAQTNVTWTVNSSGVSLNAGGYAGTVTGITGGIGLTANTSGVSVSVPAYLTTAALSNHSHGNPTLALTNLSGTTASASNGLTLSLSAAAPGGGGGSQSVGMSTQTAGGATGGTTGYAQGSAIQYLLVPGSNITMSQSVNGSSGTMSIYGPSAGAGALINRSAFEIIDGERLTAACNPSGASFSKRPILVPFWMDGASMGLQSVRMMISRAAGTSLNMTMGLGFYSMNNSTQISLHASTTHAYSLTTSGQWSGVRRLEFTGMGGSSLSEGRWVMGVLVSGSNNSTAVAQFNIMGGDAFPLAGIIHPGTNSTAATASNSRWFPFWGVYSVTSAGFPNAIGLSEVSGANANDCADIYAAIIEGTW
jgi:hypothetical protein